MLRLKGDGIITGDRVEFDENLLVLKEVLERKNFLIRPAISNIDYLGIVISNPPAPDLLLVDKLICAARSKNIDFFIVVNKCDLQFCEIDRIISCYGSFCRVFVVSALTGEGMDELRDFLRGRLVSLGGQSAVGKTSIINNLLSLDKKTGEVSQKSGRGRHTTTVTEILQKDGFYIADTPGFSSVFSGIDKLELAEVFFEGETDGLCRFSGCLHESEPGCAVKQKLSETERYQRYLQILAEVKAKKLY